MCGFSGYALNLHRLPRELSGVESLFAITVAGTVMLLWNAGNHLIGPARAAIFINLIPVFGTVLAITFLGERLYFYHVAGGTLVALGLYLAAGRR